MPAKKRLILLVTIVTLLLVLTLPFIIYFSISSLPLSYWVISKLNYRNNVFTKTVYLHLFANPMSKLFPAKSGNFYYPIAKEILLLSNKNYLGEYYYEGYGHIINVNKLM